MRWISCCATALFVAFTSSCSGAPDAGESVEAQIATVEASLAAPVALEGEERPRWALGERMEYHRVPGVSIAVFVDGGPGWARAYGVRDAAAGGAVDPQTLFQAPSLSKPVAAFGMLRLVEQDILSLDEPVNDRLVSWRVPDNQFTTAQPVTLRHLLAHGGGLTMGAVPDFAQDADLPTAADILAGRRKRFRRWRDNTSPKRRWDRRRFLFRSREASCFWKRRLSSRENGSMRRPLASFSCCPDRSSR